MAGYWTLMARVIAPRTASCAPATSPASTSAAYVFIVDRQKETIIVVLLPVDDEHIAALVDAGDVAGAQEAVLGHHPGGLVGPLPVAGHDLRSLDAQFARFAERRSRPAASRIAISVDGSGRPMAPVKFSMVSGLATAAGEVSVSP